MVRWRVFGFMLAAMGVLLLAGPATAELVVDVSPHHLRVGYGSSASLVLTVRDEGGAKIEAVANWEVVPARLGTITPDGQFTGTGIGRGIVRATVSAGGETAVGHAMVTVTPLRDEPTALLALDPPSARVSPGSTVRFRLDVTDPATGAPITERAEWRVVPETLGHVDASGLFTAGDKPGSGHVVARLSGTRRGLAEARVIVGAAPQGDLQVRVLPERALLRPGDSRRFEARITSRDGTEVDPQITVEWSVLPPELGVITRDGTLTAGRETADGRVVATVATREGVSRGFASVAVRAAAERPLAIQIHPAEAVVSPGDEIRFEATVLGPEGVIRDAVIEWSLDPAAIGVITPDGRFVASQGANGPQRGRVIARTRHDGASATAQAGIVIGRRLPELWLRVAPQRATVTPGEQVQFTAELMGAGNLEPRPPAEIRWTLESTEIGTITPGGLFTASTTVGNTGSPNFGRRDGVVTATTVLADGRIARGTAIIVVRQPGAQEGMSLQPSSVALQRGESATFRLVVGGVDAERLGYTVRWSVIPNDLGRISGGDFVASDIYGSPRSGRVMAIVSTPDGVQHTRESAVRVSPARGEPDSESR